MNILAVKNKYMYKVITTARSKMFSILYRTYSLVGGKNTISVYCYHSFANDTWPYSIKPPEFKKQIKRLIHDGYNFKSIDDLSMHITGKKLLLGKIAVITIDDGYENVHDIVDFMLKNSIPGAFFILAHPEHVDRSEIDNTYKLLSMQQIKKLSKMGFTIGFHGSTHKNLTTLNTSELNAEISLGKKTLEKKLGHKIVHFAYPKGRFNQKVIKHIRRSGFETAFAMGDINVHQKDNIFEIPRIGIDNSYSLADFISLSSPLVISTKKLIHKMYI